jgi:hypothetical protein
MEEIWLRGNLIAGCFGGGRRNCGLILFLGTTTEEQ